MSAINQAIRGETEGIRRYVGDVTDATLQNYLFAQGIKKKVKSLSQEEKRLLRVKVMLAQTTNNKQQTNNSPRTVNVNQTNNISGVANSGAAVNIIKAGARQAAVAAS